MDYTTVARVLHEEDLLFHRDWMEQIEAVCGILKIKSCMIQVAEIDLATNERHLDFDCCFGEATHFDTLKPRASASQHYDAVEYEDALERGTVINDYTGSISICIQIDARAYERILLDSVMSGYYEMITKHYPTYVTQYINGPTYHLEVL